MRITTVILAVMMVMSSQSIAQNSSVEIENILSRLNTLEQLTNKLNQQSMTNSAQLLEYEAKLKKANDSIANLKVDIYKLQSRMHDVTNQLGMEIKETKETTDGEISNLNDSVTQKTVYWILSFLLGVSLTVFGFVLLRKQSNKDKITLAEQIKNTSAILRDEQLKWDDQLLKLLETQMKLMDEQRRKVPSPSDEIDHSLALKVADEIVRIQNNLMHMAPETKGLKQLQASVRRIQDNFEANGYEMIEMLNKTYDEGMKVSVNFRVDEKLSKDEKLITRVIKPQVNFRGIAIQIAQIEVSCGSDE